MPSYVEVLRARRLPRVPLEGSLDLTYRCNNDCRHCWIRIPAASDEASRELTTDEVKDIVDQARALGCRKWSISGGEPMLRPDFPELFDFVTRHSRTYTLNTNGTLITPQIAQLMRRKGAKLVSLYGATAQVHDHITRRQGSFENAMRGIAYLREAGAGFTVQLVPMHDNYHQYDEMVALAESLSPVWRLGAAWLYLSADGNPDRNREIARQRLSARETVDLMEPVPWESRQVGEGESATEPARRDDRLLASCIRSKRDFFHIDPYGNMTFCPYVQSPGLRYDLREGSFREGWDSFVPSLAGAVSGGEEYEENCGSCDLRSDCDWCPGYAYLEHGRFSARVEYLCQVAREKRVFRQTWRDGHRRYYQVAGITIQVEADLPLTDTAFKPKFKQFEVTGPGEDTITIRHRFGIPNLADLRLGAAVHRRPPWAIHRSGQSWIYVGILPEGSGDRLHSVLVFNDAHTRATVYTDGEAFRKGGSGSLTFLPTDQILLARILADREGCFLHAAGVAMDGKGLLFAGHSGAGKSTAVRLLGDRAQLLCDDRMIVRRWPTGFQIHGNWSHGQVPEVSPDSAPLRAILFLEKAQENALVRITDPRQALAGFLGCLVRPLVTTDWWERELALLDRIVEEVPFYVLRFDTSGEFVQLLHDI